MSKARILKTSFHKLSPWFVKLQLFITTDQHLLCNLHWIYCNCSSLVERKQKIMKKATGELSTLWCNFLCASWWLNRTLSLSSCEKKNSRILNIWNWTSMHDLGMELKTKPPIYQVLKITSAWHQHLGSWIWKIVQYSIKPHTGNKAGLIWEVRNNTNSRDHFKWCISSSMRSRSLLKNWCSCTRILM